MLTPTVRDGGVSMLTRSGPGDDRPPKVALAVHGRQGAGARARRLTAFLLGLAAAGPACVAGAAEPADPTALAIKRTLTVEYHVAADGSWTSTEHGALQALSESAVGVVGRQNVGYDESSQEARVTEAVTEKADGRTLPVDPSAIVTTSPPNVGPLLPDLRQTTILFPDVAPGDTVRFTVERKSREPLFPGQFLLAQRYTVDGGAFSAHVTIEAPAGFPLQTKEQGFTTERRESGDSVVYDWRLERESTKAEINRQPYIIASSFRDYLQLGEAYGERARPKLVVTPRVRELADRLTAGVDDRREQVRRLYEHVVRNVRYEALALGSGRVVPRDPDTILATGYGDCKDHALLLAALLAAKGIATEQALINAGLEFALDGPPSLVALNHVVDYVPELDLYLDSTAPAPFGLLPPQLYDKPVVRVGASGSQLARVPPLVADSDAVTARSVVRIAADGSISGERTEEATGPDSVALRIETALVARVPDRTALARRVLRNEGAAGDGSFTFDPPYTLTGDTYGARTTFRFDKPCDTCLHGVPFGLSPGLHIVARPGSLLAAIPEKPPAQSPDGTAKPAPPVLCRAGRQSEEIALEAPEGYHFEHLPEGSQLELPLASFRSTYDASGRTLTVRRELVSRVPHGTCSAEEQDALRPLVSALRADQRQRVTMAADAPTTAPVQ
jgi:transglutaminase-like putative cysteine protease